MSSCPYFPFTMNDAEAILSTLSTLGKSPGIIYLSLGLSFCTLSVSLLIHLFSSSIIINLVSLMWNN